MTCLATTRKGNPCRFRTASQASYCLNHREGSDTSAAGSHAGRASGQSRREPSINLLETAIGLYDRPSIQAALDSVLRLTLSGAITPERARVAIHACSAAARNFDTNDNLGGRKTADHDPTAYYTKVRAVLSSIDPLLQQANAADTPPNAEESQPP